MKKSYIFILLIIPFLIVSCENYNKKEVVKSIATKPINNDIQDTIISSIDSMEYVIPKCECVLTSEYKYSFKADLTFNKKYWEKEKVNFLNLKKDSIVKIVKTLRLDGFDTIPIELSVLTNIENVFISTRNGIKGLDNFPQLKVVGFWGSSIIVDEKEKWFGQINYLRLEKSRINNLSSISLFKNLKQLDIFHSGFNGLPPSFDTLKCLNRLNIRAYLGDKIILKEIDLKKMTCLKYLHILDAYNTLIGIPNNVSVSNLDYIYVNNIGMTEDDKKIIEEYKKAGNTVYSK
jgi:hypothetical protein